MKSISIYNLFFLALLFRGIQGHSQELVLKFSDAKKTFTIESHQLFLQSQWASPVTQPAFAENGWSHKSSSVNETRLSGLPGNCATDVFRNRDLQLEREVWISADKSVIAIRQRMNNLGKAPVHLQMLVPLACKPGDMRLPENPEPGNWNILVQKRFKNDVPESVIPHASTSIKADPFFITPVGKDKNGASLLIGYLNQSDHLAHFDLSFRAINNKTTFNGLYANCEFNGVVVPPKGERTSQWIYITVGPTFDKAIGDYTGRVGDYNNVSPPPANAPSVFCSWYYHAWSYNEALFGQDIETFKKNRMPFDVFLIDESWDVGNWGDMMPNKDWPGGMRRAADMIREAGYIPGIWTCPYLVDTSSDFARKHREWTLKTSGGDQYIFRMNNVDHWVLDPTYPGVLDYLENVYRRIARDWGYRYFKFDFMRAVVMDKDFKLFNPYVTRLEAYRMGLEAIRRGVGEKAYISVCGGHYGGSLGIAHSQRSGSDVVSYWDRKEIPKYRQNILRTWMSRLWHVDPDAMMVRRSDVKVHPGLYENLSLGKFTDKEAQVNALNQYIGGGLVSFSEDFSAIDADRRELYKHIIPSVNASSYPLDWQDTLIPSYMVTKIDPHCKKLDKWNTLTVINWKDEKQNVSFELNDRVVQDLPGERFLLFEFFSQQVKGIYKKGDLVEWGELAPHAGILIKIIPWNGQQPVLAGTDLHFSMGGVEVSDWTTSGHSVKGAIQTDWQYPVQVTAVFPAGNKPGFVTGQITLQPAQHLFWITKPTGKED